MKRRDYAPVLFLCLRRARPAILRRHPRRTIAVIWIVLSIISAKSISGIDLNNDGMSDVWQQKYAVQSADASLDYDGTGLTNSQKSLLGLDPRDPNSRFHLEIVSDSANKPASPAISMPTETVSLPGRNTNLAPETIVATATATECLMRGKSRTDLIQI